MQSLPCEVLVLSRVQSHARTVAPDPGPGLRRAASDPPKEAAGQCASCGVFGLPEQQCELRTCVEAAGLGEHQFTQHRKVRHSSVTKDGAEREDLEGSRRKGDSWSGTRHRQGSPDQAGPDPRAPIGVSPHAHHLTSYGLNYQPVYA